MSIQWIVNTAGELGVLVNDTPIFMYKGEPFVYESGVEYRKVEKREFGESGPVVEQDIEAHDWTSWTFVPVAADEAQVAAHIKQLSFPDDGIKAVNYARAHLGLSLMEAVSFVRQHTGWCQRSKRFV